MPMGVTSYGMFCNSKKCSFLAPLRPTSPISKRLSGTLSLSLALSSLLDEWGTNSDLPIVFMTADPSCGQRLLGGLGTASSEPFVLRPVIRVVNSNTFKNCTLTSLNFTKKIQHIH